MKCSLRISDFLEEIPSLSHSVVFLYFFALIAEEGFLISSGAVARRSNATPKARGCDREDQPHVQGAVAARAQESVEELSHVEGQEERQ